jgi:aspartate ammonia-lyase
MQSFAPFVAVSNAIENLTLDITRIANDIRLLSSGPMTGLFEIVLPTVQPGSSIMPGKINPSIAEMVNQVSYYVLGNAQCVRFCSQAGQLELNVMMPVTAFALIQMIQILGNALEVFAAKCVEGLTANSERCRDYAERSISVVTALNTYIGYLKAAEIAKQAVREQRKITDIAMEQGLLSQEQLKEVLNLEAMTHVGIPGKEHAA